MIKGKLLTNGQASSSRQKRDQLSRSRKQEKKTAKTFGGRLVVGSGNQWYAKSDVRSKPFLIECKRTDKNSFTLHYDMLDEHTKNAFRAGKDPVVEIEFSGERWVVLPMFVMEKLVANAEMEDND